MKDIKNFIVEGSQLPFDITQDLSQGSIGFLTLTIGRQKNKSENGFLCYSEDNKTVQLVAFDKDDTTILQKLLHVNEYENLLGMKAQETKRVDDKLYVKLW